MQKTRVRLAKKRDLPRMTWIMNENPWLYIKLKQTLDNENEIRKGNKVFIAEKNGMIVGVSTLFKKQESAYLGSLLVHPEERRKGIARLLTLVRIEHAIRRMKPIRIIVSLSNPEKGAKTYERMGFKRIEGKPREYALNPNEWKIK